MRDGVRVHRDWSNPWSHDHHRLSLVFVWYTRRRGRGQRGWALALLTHGVWCEKSLRCEKVKLTVLFFTAKHGRTFFPVYERFVFVLWSLNLFLFFIRAIIVPLLNFDLRSGNNHHVPHTTIVSGNNQRRIGLASWWRPKIKRKYEAWESDHVLRVRR